MTHKVMVRQSTARTGRTARRLAAWVLLVGATAAAEPAAAQSCQALTRSDVETLAPSDADVRRLQGVLYEAYPDAPQAADESRSVFVDGIVGSRTLQLTRRFCLDLGLDAVADPGPLVREGAAAFAAAVGSDPGWRATLASGDFREWARGIPTGTRFPFYRIGPDGPVAPTAVLLLADFRANRTAVYVLTQEALATLAEPPETAAYRVSQGAVARLRAWGAPQALVGALAALRDLPAESPAAVREQVAQVLGSDTLTSELGDTVPASGVLALLGGDAMVERVQPEAALVGATVTEEVLARLATLQDVRFPSRSLFRDALRVEAGIGASRPALRSRVEAAARTTVADGGGAAVEVKPIRWDGVCGCGTFVKNSDAYPLYLYGMYPFWAAPQAADSTDRGQAPEVEVDFSLLTRVGYHALGFDERGAVGDPLHWRTGDYPEDAFFWQRASFARFAHVAHQHKTAVDLVLANEDWSRWLPGTSADTAGARDRIRTALERLSGDAVGLITPRLDPVLERIKPVISLGQSPRRTLGDGLTLDLDFSALAPEDEAWLVGALLEERFLPGLRERLGQAADVGSGLVLDLGLDYALNLVVPAYCLVEEWGGPGAPGCALYSWSTLAELEPSLDLILVDFTREPPTPGAWESRPSDLALAQAVDRGTEALPVETRVRLLGRLLPLVATGHDPGRADELAPVFHHADWNFGGAGMWSLPLDSAVTGRMTEAFVHTPAPRRLPTLLEAARAPLAALQVEARVCRVVCPLRWPLRTFVFLTGVALVALWLASLQWLGLKRVYETPWVPLAFAVVGMALMGTLWCDPYWSERKSTILFLFLGGLMAWLVVDWARKRRWYP